jgi:hypothetical protein
VITNYDCLRSLLRRVNKITLILITYFHWRIWNMMNWFLTFAHEPLRSGSLAVLWVRIVLVLDNVSNLFGLIILVWWSYVGLGCVYIVGLGIVWSCAIKCKSIISCWVTNVMLYVLLVQVVLGRDRFIRYFIAPQDQVHIVLAYSNKWFYNNRYLCWYISDGLGRAYILFL